MQKINIAIAGGPCTGKTTLAAHLFAHLKIKGFEYDLILEECRKIKKEFGLYNGPFERFYMWRQQEREELRSNAHHGFITDTPLFSYYAQVHQHATQPRDKLALRELYRMCLELDQQNRYHLILLAENPDEIPYRKDATRRGEKENARQRHAIVKTFVEHLWPERILYVHGGLEERTDQALAHIKKLHKK